MGILPDVGSVTNGSSGSALWDQDKRLVGILSGGEANCDLDLPVYYGRFSASWEYGTDPAKMLRPFLDRAETGAVTLDTIDPGCAEPAECDDGLFCNGEERCLRLTCYPGLDPCPCALCDEDADECIPVTDDADSRAYADLIREILLQG